MLTIWMKTHVNVETQQRHSQSTLYNVRVILFPEEVNWEATKQIYRELLLVFEQIILPTHASCHVQFIMFYLCSIKQVNVN